jgi:hypothetical protein
LFIYAGLIVIVRLRTKTTEFSFSLYAGLMKEYRKNNEKNIYITRSLKKKVFARAYGKIQEHLDGFQ